MTKYLLLLATVAIGAGLLFAPAAQAAVPHQGVVIHGMILGFDPANHLMALATPMGPVPVRFGPETNVFINFHPAPLPALNRGMRAAVLGRPNRQNGVFRANTIFAFR